MVLAATMERVPRSGIKPSVRNQKKGLESDTGDDGSDGIFAWT